MPQPPPFCSSGALRRSYSSVVVPYFCVIFPFQGAFILNYYSSLEPLSVFPSGALTINSFWEPWTPHVFYLWALIYSFWELLFGEPYQGAMNNPAGRWRLVVQTQQRHGRTSISDFQTVRRAGSRVRNAARSQMGRKVIHGLIEWRFIDWLMIDWLID